MIFKMAKNTNHLGGHCNITHVDEGILSYVQGDLNVKTMLDIGCGPGGQIFTAQKIGIEAEGIDGLPGPAKLDVKITIHDFTENKYEHGKKFDFGWSCEFLEHVDERFMENYMNSFQACKYIFVTYAPKGKVGHHHVNCQDQEYWINKFSSFGFEYDEERTSKARELSTMGRNFARHTGLMFKNLNHE